MNEWDLPDDRELLARIAQEHPEPSRRLAASERLAFAATLDGMTTDETAHAAGHSAEAWQREAAFKRLLPCIERVALRVSQRFGQGVATYDLAESAPGILWLKASKYNRDRGSFNGWAQTVLYNEARSRLRQAKKLVSLSWVVSDNWASPIGDDNDDETNVKSRGTAAHDGEPIDTRQSCEQEELGDLRHQYPQVETWLREIRNVLDRVGQRNTGAGVNYHAVMLLSLRLKLAAIMAGAPEHTDQADYLAWCLPWRDHEETMTLRPGWPNLAVIWSAFREPLGQPPNVLSSAEACQGITKLLGGQATLALATWNQWVKRAKERLRSQMNDAEAWQRCFAPLFADRDR